MLCYGRKERLLRGPFARGIRSVTVLVLVRLKKSFVGKNRPFFFTFADIVSFSSFGRVAITVICIASQSSSIRSRRSSTSKREMKWEKKYRACTKDYSFCSTYVSISISIYLLSPKWDFVGLLGHAIFTNSQRRLFGLTLSTMSAPLAISIDWQMFPRHIHDIHACCTVVTGCRCKV